MPVPSSSALTLPLPRPPLDVVPVLDRDALRLVVHLVHAHEPRRELKHVVAQRDDDELRVLGALLDIVGHDGHLP